MKFITAILILALAAVCAAQPVRPEIGILAAVEGCSPVEVRDNIQCGCFITLFGAPTNAKIRGECAETIGVPVRESQTACDDFLIDDGTNYDFPAILAKLQFVKNTCFGGELTIARAGSIAENFEILSNARALFELLNKVCAALDQPTVSDVPHPDRMIAGASLKTHLLRQYNNL